MEMSPYSVDAINAVLSVLGFAILGRGVLARFDPRGATPVTRILFQITEPIQGPIRKLVLPAAGLDLSCCVSLLLRMVSVALMQSVAMEGASTRRCCRSVPTTQGTNPPVPEPARFPIPGTTAAREPAAHAPTRPPGRPR